MAHQEERQEPHVVNRGDFEVFSWIFQEEGRDSAVLSFSSFTKEMKGLGFSHEKKDGSENRFRAPKNNNTWRWGGASITYHTPKGDLLRDNDRKELKKRLGRNYGWNAQTFRAEADEDKVRLRERETKQMWRETTKMRSQAAKKGKKGGRGGQKRG
ncbi:hypothetical protein BD309DRAFT_958928 [Dichomitus squalens]|uniref:Uncharacterized protein n=1 Tax=Dichomitus squalens TaxID=114155 RepID=A0A4Q9NX41_9APHY|nr:hypothetical protein BD309DRAFT_958928 [Dichomitus squalens]TBU61475.1 hypothetical protein BD310DRAFT_920830 [Dichomitus squalens]